MMRMRNRRGRPAMRTRHNNRSRVRIGYGDSIDDELFAAAKAAKVTSPYGRHITRDIWNHAEISIQVFT